MAKNRTKIRRKPSKGVRKYKPSGRSKRSKSKRGVIVLYITLMVAVIAILFSDVVTMLLQGLNPNVDPFFWYVILLILFIAILFLSLMIMGRRINVFKFLAEVLG